MKEAVRVSDLIMARHVCWIGQDRPIRVGIFIAWDKSLPALRSNGLGDVDEILVVETVEVGWCSLGRDIAECRHRYRQSCESLLTIDDPEVAKVVEGINGQ